MKSAVTVSLVSEAKGGPFVFWDNLEQAAVSASELGFDAIEIFPPSPDAIDVPKTKELLAANKLSLAAVGTGGGWVIRKQHLCHPDASVRSQARDFIRSIIDCAGQFGAPAIIGSMQGRFEGGVSREQAITWLGKALNDLGEHATQYGCPLLYEPLNRYETNLFNRLEDTVSFLKTLTSQNVRILADLFHMNIEEADVADALEQAGNFVGHIHFVDSNRKAAGMGHTDFEPIISALKRTGFEGYLSAEAFSQPDALSAAKQTIDSFNKLTR